MEQEIVYKVSEKDLRNLLVDQIRSEIKAQEQARLNSRIIDVDTMAKLHGVSRETVYNYINSGDIQCEPRPKNGSCKIRLGYALQVDFKELKRRLKISNYERTTHNEPKCY